jgi:hypothetical protein
MPTGSLGLEGMVSNAWGRGTGPAARPTGSSSRTRMRRLETGGGGRLEMDAVTRTAREGVRETRVIWGR